MKISNPFSGSIRARIFFGFLFPIIPLIAIVLINYYPTRDNTLETGRRLMELSTKSYAEKINTYFNAQETLFSDWTEVDVFGMAIEFNTLKELKNHFDSMMKGHPEFTLLLLTDENGIVLEAAAGSAGAIAAAESIKGIKLAETVDLMKRNDHMVSFVKTDPIGSPGQKDSYTALYSFKTRNSSGDANGFFLGFLDWSIVRKMIHEMDGEMKLNGFSNSRIAMVDGETLNVITHSKKEFPKNELPAGMPIKRISAGEKDRITRVSTDRGMEYVISAPLNVTPNLLIYDRVGTGSSDIYLTVFVTKTEILLRVRRIFTAALLILGVGASVFLIICVFIAQSITHPMRRLVDVLEQYGKGDMNVRAELKSRDEIGFFAQKFNAMLEQINASALTLRNSESRYRSLFENLQEAINSATYSYRFTPESKEDDLSISLNRMLSTLQEADIRASNQDWLKTGQTEFSDILSGERKIDDLCRKAIIYIAKYVGAQVGTFYVKESEKEEFVLVANYAFRERKGFINRVKPGEGLVGQAALEKERILFSEVPDDYLRIESSLGHTACENILVIPVVYEEDVKGVVELGKLNEFTKQQVDFLELAGNIMAVSIYSAMFNEKLQKLLDHTKQQSEVLKEQQEELKTTNEELQEQTEILKESKAKLQLQQEELQASNEELEEKTELLESQKGEIEKKNTALQEKQREVEEKARQLEMATKYKSEFLANMSHELRTPLNSMLLLANMLAENEEKNLNEDQVLSAASIHRSGQNLLHLINDILDLSKIEAKKIELSISSINLSTFAENFRTEFMHVAADAGLEFNTYVEEGVPPAITTDVYRLEQIARNLIVNALKFTERGSVSLRIGRPVPFTVFETKELEIENVVAISVEDTGPGIEEEKMQIIFESFKQVDGSISRRHGGTGLGLSISRELAALIGGELSAKSTPGKGTVFTIFIPERIAVAGDAPALPREETGVPKLTDREKAKKSSEETGGKKQVFLEKPIEKPAPSQKTMLIIEDDPEFAQILADFFQKNGYESIIAPDGETGIKFVIEHQPTAIILDIGLPGIDGWAVLNELKGNPDTRHIPVHIMSAFDNTRQGLEKGAVGYLTKPVSAEGLRSAMNRIEDVLTSDVKDLLVVEDDKELQFTILKMMGTNDIHAVAAGTGEQALAQLRKKRFDCMILDLGLPDISGFELLDRIETDDSLEKTPVIIYTGRDLSKEENERLERYSSSIVLKSAKSMERLLDETALFMHRVESDMPEDHRKMIQRLRDKESVLTGKKVLLADDDMRSAFALNKFLKSRGMEVTIANNGNKALEILEKGEKPDIVLMDIMMPQMDGYETMKRIRSQNEFKDLPILALTAKAMETDREECIRCGANDYLSKPVDTAKLITMLRVWLY